MGVLTVLSQRTVFSSKEFREDPSNREAPQETKAWQADCSLEARLTDNSSTLIGSEWFLCNRSFSVDGSESHSVSPTLPSAHCLIHSEREVSAVNVWLWEEKNTQHGKGKDLRLIRNADGGDNNLGNNDTFCGSQNQVRTAIPMPVSSVSGRPKWLPYILQWGERIAWIKDPNLQRRTHR